MQNQETVHYLFNFIPIWKVHKEIDTNKRIIISRYYFLGLPVCKICQEYDEDSEIIEDYIY